MSAHAPNLLAGSSESLAFETKRTLSQQIKLIMASSSISQAELARRMSTSRAVVRRLLDEGDLSVTLLTISKAACALDCTLMFGLEFNR